MQYHVKQMFGKAGKNFPEQQLKDKLAIPNKKKNPILEIDNFIADVFMGRRILKDGKLKLCNDLSDMGRIFISDSTGHAIARLAQKNLVLRHSEDGARRKDVRLGYAGRIRIKIGLANQQRNDYIDSIDQLLEEKINSLPRK